MFDGGEIRLVMQPSIFGTIATCGSQDLVLNAVLFARLNGPMSVVSIGAYRTIMSNSACHAIGVAI
jgi:hypothetical protein